MVSFHPANPRRSRALLLVVLLLLTLGLAGVLAYQAQDAARSHRAAAENTLRDYASFAAWEFARLSRSHLYCMVQSTMLPFPQGLDASTALPEPTPELWDEACDCHINADYFFRLDARDRSLVTTGGSPPPTERRRVVEALASSLSASHDTDSPASLLLAHLDGDMRVLVYRIAREHGEPVAIYGAAGPLEELQERLGHAFAEAVPLPPSLAGDVVTDSVVALSILAGDHEAYRSGPAEPVTYAAEDTLGLRYGGLVAFSTPYGTRRSTSPSSSSPRAAKRPTRYEASGSAPTTT